MKRSSTKKSSAAANQSTLSAAKPPHPTAKMSVATALSYLDFSVFPPEPKSTHAALGDELVHRIGHTLLDGIRAAFVQHDTAKFVQCYEALHYCLGGDMESRLVNFGPSGKVSFLMTAYQAAVAFDHVDMVTALFKTCLASPEYPIRAGISTPMTMITHAFSTGKQGAPEREAAWMAIVDDMIAALVERLAEVGPDDLCPTTGMVFQTRDDVKPGPSQDALTRLCSAMAARHRQLIAQSSNDPQAFDTNNKRL